MTAKSQNVNREQVFIVQADNKVYVELPDLKIIGKGASVQKAYDDAAKQRRDLLAAYREADIMDRLPDPSHTTPRRPASAGSASSPGALKSFALKSGIIACVIAVTVLVLTSAITSQVRKEAARLDMKAGGQFWEKVEQRLAKAANSRKDLSPERREKVTEDLRKLAARIKPYVDAFAQGLSDGVATPAPGPDSASQQN